MHDLVWLLAASQNDVANRTAVTLNVDISSACRAAACSFGRHIGDLMSTTMTFVLGATPALLATARALEQLLHLRRITGAPASPMHVAPASLLAPAAGAMTLMYAHIVGADSALMAATTINTLSATAIWAWTCFLRASHRSALKAAEPAAGGDQL